jgi:hypothetical protein
MSASTVISYTVTGTSLTIPSARFFSPCTLDMSWSEAASTFRPIALRKCELITLTEDPLSSINLKLYPATLARQVSGVIS